MAVAESPRVLVADDHEPTRAMIRRAIQADGFVVCAEVTDAFEAIAAARASTPDVAVLDVRMPGSGLYAAAMIKAQDANISIVMLTVSDLDDDLFAALAAGADGYLLKGQDPAAIPDALRRTLAGEAALSGTLVNRLVREFRMAEKDRTFSGRLPRGIRLTSKEREVLELLNQDLGTKEIAGRLFVAEVTVRTHIASILRKLQVKDRADALTLLRGPADPAQSVQPRPTLSGSDGR